ncbi:hypothetical protein IZ6_15670 [Terrihabitans soli]|uniref:Uncharacterized protein n=1 Tax=Terrihabitans soli TaxID=708113 RepID=A0A6S6QU96_9HYPH|nr:hypothetical protein [Terrihabitans soli]BCJ90832.1 hypothetical protein IZ6_15670 [Terrihabitans soli]
MFELSLFELTGIVLGSVGAGGFVGVQFYRCWLDQEVVDLDAIEADRAMNRDRENQRQ